MWGRPPQCVDEIMKFVKVHLGRVPRLVAVLRAGHVPSLNQLSDQYKDIIRLEHIVLTSERRLSPVTMRMGQQLPELENQISLGEQKADLASSAGSSSQGDTKLWQMSFKVVAAA